MIALLLWACSPASVPSSPSDPATVGADGAEGGDDGVADGGDVEHAGGDPDGGDGGDDGGPPRGEYGCAAVYDADQLPVFDVEISAAEWSGLQADYRSGRKEYHPIVLHHDGEAIDAAIRLKGNPNFSWFGDKLQFVVSFNETDPDGRWQGQRKLAFDATWYEPTLLRDRVSWAVMRQREDLPAACANNAFLTVNGEPYGLYANIEYFDREYLERYFGDEAAMGTLWKYGEEAKSNAENADRDRLADFWSARSVADMRAVGDVDQWLRMWAAEAVLGDDDGFLCCEHNFYLYDHPDRGILMVPWDFDDVMDVAPHSSDPIVGYGEGLFRQQHVLLAMADPSLRAAFVEEVAAMNALMDPAALTADIDTWNAQIEGAVLEDQHHTWGLEERGQTLDRMKRWIRDRHAFIDAWVACERGSPVDADGDGLDSCSDLDDGHPVGPEVCNGRDDDNNGRIDDDPACDDCARRDMDERHLLFCSLPRTQAEAAAHCAERGGSLATLPDTESAYMAFFYAWPYTEPWWIAGGSRGLCRAWDEGRFTTVDVDCASAHPSICSLP